MSQKDKAEPLYRVVFQHEADEYELYSRFLYQSDLYGFIELEQLAFGERSSLVVDPKEEKLKLMFSGVKRTFIPMKSIVRIDEMDGSDSPSTLDLLEPNMNHKSNITHFPTSFTPPRNDR